MIVKISLGKPQPKQKEFMLAMEKYVAFGGARGGGKSWSVREKAKRLAMKWGGIKILIIRKTYLDLRDNHILPLKADLPQRYVPYKEVDKSFVFPNGSRIKCSFFDNDTDALQYQGQEYDVIFLEEATQFSELVFNVLKACLRGANNFPKRMYLTCNPDGIGFLWVKRLFVSRKYKEGEQVVVKTNIILDMSLTVYVNGKSIGTGKAIKTGDEYTHWEYYFTMPSEDVTITFEEKDGMLPPSLRDEALASRDVAWANYADGDYIEDALNFDKFGLAPGQKPDANHLPIYKFSTLAEFEAFKTKYAETFEMNSSYDEVQSFAEATQYMAETEGYWNTYDLCVIYVMTSTCSTRDSLTDVVTDGTKVCFYVNTTYDLGEPYDEAMGGWFVITSLPKNMIADYTEYDAVTGNP